MAEATEDPLLALVRGVKTAETSLACAQAALERSTVALHTPVKGRDAKQFVTQMAAVHAEHMPVIQAADQSCRLAHEMLSRTVSQVRSEADPTTCLRAEIQRLAKADEARAAWESATELRVLQLMEDNARLRVAMEQLSEQQGLMEARIVGTVELRLNLLARRNAQSGPPQPSEVPSAVSDSAPAVSAEESPSTSPLSSPSGEVVRTFSESSLCDLPSAEPETLSGESAPLCFSEPYDVWATPQGDVFVSDYNNQRVQRLIPSADNRYREVTFAGGNGRGPRLTQFNGPCGLQVTHTSDPSGDSPPGWWLYVADSGNDRVTRWAESSVEGEVVAGGNGAGAGLHQLSGPEFIFITEDSSAIYISDRLNHRVVRWELGARAGVVVAGGNGKGSSLQQLSDPRGVWVLTDQDVYVSDFGNGRVVLWQQGSGTRIKTVGAPSRAPCGLVVLDDATVVVSQMRDNRVQLFPPGSCKGITLAGGHGQGNSANQLHWPTGIHVDLVRRCLLVADRWNNRIQRLVLRSADPPETPDEP
eukprot:TRINITY_DN19065_c0_g1_i1.p1 TRINITY_DN19065_c0_g1~~TRINITY_DN19065_c0_g1_i1.p1  ORF type:complete len:540 (-),score=61.71 TRINITY_DN19065_c0_g1_i1:43-1635(-)